jgi:hypothetical protein
VDRVCAAGQQLTLKLAKIRSIHEVSVKAAAIEVFLLSISWL